MATKAIPGFGGYLYASADGGSTYDKIGEIREATLTIEHESIDATSHDSAGWRENIGGLRGWSVSADALYLDYNDDDGQAAVHDALTGATDVTLKLVPKIQTALGEWSGLAKVTSYELSLPNDDAAAVSLEFEGNGLLDRDDQ